MKKTVMKVGMILGASNLFSAVVLCDAHAQEELVRTQELRIDDQTDKGYVRHWRGMIGIAVGTEPKFPGAKDSHAALIPVGRITYDRFFIGGVAGVGPGVGAYLYRDRNFELTAGVAHNIGDIRKESDAPHLNGLGNVKGTTWAGMSGEYHNRWMKAELSLASDIGGNHLGTLATLGIQGVWHVTPQLELSAGPKMTYGSAKYEQTLFGITADQSRASGLPIYTPKAGIVQNALEFGAAYKINEKWLVGAKATVSRLSGDAGSSPITEKKSQTRAGVYFGYRF